MKKLYNNFKLFFGFSKPERRGIIILVTIIIFFVLLRIFYVDFIQKKSKLNIKEFSADIEKFLSNIDTSQPTYTSRKDNFDFNNSDKSFSINQLNPFPFNPNEMSKDQWKKLGLRDKQISVIENYISKGGKFYKKDDFKKMYCISSEEYTVLEPFINIPNLNSNEINRNTIHQKKKLIFELNSSDTTDLQEVSGIGSSFAKRIIKYRDMLGGFVNTDQLLEVFGMDSTRYNQILPQLVVDTTNIKKIDINNITLQELKKHPYFGYYLAKSIITYREKKGNFKSLIDLKKVPLIYDDIYEKISSYLIIN